MPEDDDPTLRHIPAQFGVPYDDFNWPWYWAKEARLEKRRQAKEADDAFRRVTLVTFLLCVLLAFIIACTWQGHSGAHWPRGPTLG